MLFFDIFFTVLFSSRHSFFSLCSFFFVIYFWFGKRFTKKTDYHVQIWWSSMRQYKAIHMKNVGIFSPPAENQCDFFFSFFFSSQSQIECNWMQLNAFARPIKHFIRFKLKTKITFYMEVWWFCAIAASLPLNFVLYVAASWHVHFGLASFIDNEINVFSRCDDGSPLNLLL